MTRNVDDRDVFADRRDAGAALADRLRAYIARAAVVVLALPRGGVPVAHEVARQLDAPLDVFLVRKLGVPDHPELAMGAIASGGSRVLNDEVVNWYRLPRSVIDDVARREQIELERRERAYRDGRPPVDVRGKTVLLIDDGLATGSSMRAAVHAVRALEPARVVVAVPVGASEACRSLTEIADDLACVRTPAPFSAVGLWYRDFSQTTDEEVRALLQDGGLKGARSPSPRDR
jgi:putative phosphoribosyl transferase